MRAVRMSARGSSAWWVRAWRSSVRARSRIALQQRVLGELAQIMGGDAAALVLHAARQLVEDLERLGPVALGFVDAHQVIERGVAVLARGGELLEQLLGAVHEAGARVIEREREGRLVAAALAAAVLAQPRMDGDRAVDLAAAAEQAPERELDLRGIAVRLGHAREDLGGMVEAIVDQVVEADVVVARQAHGACRAVARPRNKRRGHQTNASARTTGGSSNTRRRQQVRERRSPAARMPRALSRGSGGRRRR